MKVEGSLVIPTHDADGFAGFVSLFCDQASPHPSTHRALKLIAIYALEKAKELHGMAADRVGWDKTCPLTPRQREALAFMAQGKTDWEIGQILGISEKTANHHLEAVKRKLSVATRAQAVAVAVHSGWVTL
jgi:LuxR family quorum sensing-dependent transcriptional regulator